VQQPVPTGFADGGSLENTGINGVLAYADIDSVIAFVNSGMPIQLGQFGVSDGHDGSFPTPNSCFGCSFSGRIANSVSAATNDDILELDLVALGS
jgi:hypothetical protein